MAVRCLFAFAALVALLHAIDPRDPRTHLVSEFAFEQPLLTGVAFLALGAGAGGVAVAVARVRRLAWPGAALIAAAGAAFAVLAFAQTDHEGTVEPTTAEGRLHDGLAASGALALTAGSLLAWLAARPRAAAVFFVVVNVVFWTPAVLAPDWPGLLQRAWLGVVIAGLIPLDRVARRRAAAFPGS